MYGTVARIKLLPGKEASMVAETQGYPDLKIDGFIANSVYKADAGDDEYWLAVVFENKEILKHYGKSYTFEPIRFRGSAPQITALAAGEIDIAAFAFSTFGLAIQNARMEDLRVIGDLYQDGIPGYMAHPDAPGQRPGILMVHHAHGVTADYKIDAYRLACLGFNVLAPDLFNMFGIAGTTHIAWARICRPSTATTSSSARWTRPGATSSTAWAPTRRAPAASARTAVADLAHPRNRRSRARRRPGLAA